MTFSPDSKMRVKGFWYSYWSRRTGATLGLKRPWTRQNKLQRGFSKQPTCTNGQDKQTDDERDQAFASLQDAGKAGEDHDDMGNEADQNTDDDGLEAAPFCVGNPCTEDGNNVGHESEKQDEGVGKLNALAKCTCSALGAGSGRTGAISYKNASI